MSATGVARSLRGRWLFALLLSLWLPLVALAWNFLEAMSGSAGGLSELLRADKYDVSVTTASLAMIGAVAVLALAAAAFGWDQRGRITPTILFACLFVVLVAPGVAFTTGVVVNGNLGTWAFAGATFLFAVGVGSGHLLTRSAERLTVGRSQITGNAGSRWLSPGGAWGAATALGALVVFFGTGGASRLIALRAVSDFFSTGRITETAASVRLGRAAVYYEASGALYVLQEYCMSLVMPVGGLALASEGAIRKNRLMYGLGIGFYAVAMVITIGTGSRLSSAVLLILGVVWASLSGTVNWRRIATALLTAVLMLLIMTAALGRLRDQGDPVRNALAASNRLLERIALTKGSTTGWVFEVFPNVEPFAGGRTIATKLGGLASGELSLARKMYRYLHGAEGTAGPQSFGELYANFGVGGMLAGAFVLGILVQCATAAVRSWELSDVTLRACAAFAILCVAYLGYSDVVSPKTMGLHILLGYVVVYLAFRRVYQDLQPPVSS